MEESENVNKHPPPPPKKSKGYRPYGLKKSIASKENHNCDSIADKVSSLSPKPSLVVLTSYDLLYLIIHGLSVFVSP
jgi:hypothetical protein